MRHSPEGVPTTATTATAIERIDRRRGDLATCPLAIWRTVPRERIEPAHVAALSRILSAIAILHEPRWRAATGGDPAASAAIAIGHLRGRTVGTPLADLAMSNLLVRAMEDDPTAPVILRHALAAIARLDRSDRKSAQLAAGWPGGALPRGPVSPKPSRSCPRGRT